MLMQLRSKLRSRAPDAAHRPFGGALQSRGPCLRILPCSLLGPGSAQQRCTLRRVRDTREARVVATNSVIASAAKQSRVFPWQQSGLLRRFAPRNDNVAAQRSSVARCSASGTRAGARVVATRLRSRRVGKGAQRRAHHLSAVATELVGTLRFTHPTRSHFAAAPGLSPPRSRNRSTSSLNCSGSCRNEK
ncbi:hypothetical protein ABIF66_011409 [Bradyrhizobium japonicum]